MGFWGCVLWVSEAFFMGTGDEKFLSVGVRDDQGDRPDGWFRLLSECLLNGEMQSLYSKDLRAAKKVAF